MKRRLSVKNESPVDVGGSSLVGNNTTPSVARVRGSSRYSAGFTLIELMIVLAIIAILTVIAYPAYTRYITKTRRVAAEGCLSENANFMERFYTTNLTYKTAVLPTSDCDSTGNYYAYDLPAKKLSVSAYVVRAVPQGAQKNNDTKCGTLSLDQTGKRLPSTAGCW